MRPLNRPMFRYGGPIKEGVMSGIREPHKNGQRVGLYNVGSPGQFPKTGGREHHVGPAAAAIPWFLQAARFAVRPLVRYGANVLKRAPTVGKGGEKLLTAPGQSAKFTPLQQVWDPNKAVPTGLGKYLMRSPEGRLLTGGAGWAGKVGKGIYAAGKGVAKSPLTMGGLIWMGGSWLWPDGTPANENEIAKAKASTGGPPGGGDPGMQGTGEWFDAQAQKEANIAKQKEWENRIKKYRDIMDIKGMNKEAAYKSLVDASKLIQESQDFKGDIKSGKLINQIIQATSKQFDKPSKTSDAINTLILQNELKKDLNKETTALDKAYKESAIALNQAKLAENTLAGDIRAYTSKNKTLPAGSTLAGFARARGMDIESVASTTEVKKWMADTGKTEVDFLQEVITKNPGNVKPGKHVINDKIFTVSEDLQITGQSV